LRAVARAAVWTAAIVALSVARPPALRADDQTGWLEQQTLTGNWRGYREQLAEMGILPHLIYRGMMWSNVDGGAAVGTDLTGYLDVGVKLSLHDLGAWPGSAFRISWHWFQGPSPTVDLVGGSLAMALSGWEASNAFRFYDIYFEQSLAEKRFQMKIGQLAADTDFMASTYAALFLNAAFGDLPSQNLNIDAPVYPLAAPGVYAMARPLDWLTTRIAGYTADPGPDRAGNHGFEWKIGNNAGYTFFGEIAGSREGAAAGTYTLGGVYTTGGSDQFGIGPENLDHYEVYAMVDQTVVTDARNNPKVGVFARMSGSPQDDRNVVGLYADGGVVVYGPIGARPMDAAGIAVSVMRFTDDYRQQVQATMPTLGSGAAVLELTYQLHLAPWLLVQPDVQVFFDPPLSGSNAVTLNLQVGLTF